MITKQHPLVIKATQLHNLIAKNSGSTDEWPLQICSTDPELLEQFTVVLKELREEIVKIKD